MWSLSPYPDAYDFAFTIVHDADNAYSRRLAYVFEAFDQHDFKLTLTTFAFWADWQEKGAIWQKWKSEDPLLKPKSVPLEDPDELRFYQRLEERGHEIGLHTPADQDSTRDDVIRAFEFFNTEFGHYPKVYVEHRECRQNHQNQGSRPDSKYFITDLLNHYGPWVWLVSPSALPYLGRGRYYDLLSTQRAWGGDFAARHWGTLKKFLKYGKWSRENGELFAMLLQGGTPFDHYATRKYGLLKAFRRSGNRYGAGGQAFLGWYTEHNILDLEARGGLAIVYSHLDGTWFDRDRRILRPELRDRMAFIASRNVWKAVASQILDRFRQISQTVIAQDEHWIKIANGSDSVLTGLTLMGQDSTPLFRGTERLTSNGRGKIVVGDLLPRETLVLSIGKPGTFQPGYVQPAAASLEETIAECPTQADRISS